MPIQVKCDNCGASILVPDNAVGKKARCPKCKAAFSIPYGEPDPVDDIVVAEIVPEPRQRSVRQRQEMPAEWKKFNPDNWYEKQKLQTNNLRAMLYISIILLVFMLASSVIFGFCVAGIFS